MAKEQTKARTGDDEGRIVHGGELPEDDGSLDDVEVAGVPAESAAHQPSAAAPPNSNKPAPTVEERLKLMLGTRFMVPGDNSYCYSFNPPSVQTAFDFLGHRFFEFSHLVYFTDDPPLENSPLVGMLQIGNTIPLELFRKLVEPDFSSDELDYLIKSNLGKSLGLQDAMQNGAVPVKDENLHPHFPALKQLANLRGPYVIPNDPYILLLCGVAKEDREFFSAYFDKLVADTMIESNPSVYNSGVSEYVMTFSDLRKVSGHTVSLKHLVKTAMELGVDDPEPYSEVFKGFKNVLQTVRYGKR